MSIKRTDGGIELTNNVVAIGVGLITIFLFFISITAAAMGARQQLANATPVARHDSLVVAVRENKASIDTLKRDLMGLNCQQARYPSPFCDLVPRVMQAGGRK